MATSRKAPNPSAPSADAAAGPEQASAAPSDPGPPPRVPDAPAHPVAHSIRDVLRQATAATLEEARELVQAIEVLRLPPEVHAYKAEALDWIKRRLAHFTQHGI